MSIFLIVYHLKTYLSIYSVNRNPFHILLSPWDIMEASLYTKVRQVKTPSAPKVWRENWIFLTHATYQQSITPVLSPGSNSAPASIKDTQLLFQDSLTPFHQRLERSATFRDALQISFPPLQLSQHILKQVQPLTLHCSQTQGTREADFYLHKKQTHCRWSSLVEKIKPSAIAFCLRPLSIDSDLTF